MINFRDEKLEELLEEFEPRVFCDEEGRPLVEEIEIWAQGYFQSLMDIFNGFFCHVDPAEAVERIADIPFDQLVREQLENENEAVIAVAVDIINELKNIEIEFMRAYIA